MNSNQNIENQKNPSKPTENDDLGSVDDFIKQLEAREKDLRISPDLVIEVDESELNEQTIPEFLRPEIMRKTAAPAKPAAVSVSKPVELPEKDNSLLQNEIIRLKKKVAGMEAERTEIFENSRRRQKDFENYKSRTERERGETFNNQINNLATQILPVLDNLNRALDFASRSATVENPEFQQFFDGIVLVNQQLNEVLAEMGVSPVAAVGHLFDPHFHEAVAVEESAEFAPNTVLTELLRGYRVGEKVIRPSMVKVSKSAAGKIAEEKRETVENSNEI